MTGLATLAEGAAPHHLMAAGALHLTAEDGFADGFGTLVLLAPAEPGFWAHLTGRPEWCDGAADPVDRWSRRVIGNLACDLGGKAVFPFGGPPYRPFYSWALRTGRAFVSPVSFLVHDVAGLFISYRGAIALPGHLPLPPALTSPCDTCAGQPCRTACPPHALTPEGGYDVPACHAFLDRPAGKDCLSGGCAVRRACPLSVAYGRLAVQSAYHMRLFHR